jgi:hypothetical protein
VSGAEQNRTKLSLVGLDGVISVLHELSRNCVFVSKEVKDIALTLRIQEVSSSNLG